MDRFIVQANYHKQHPCNRLKSNMDRFIDRQPDQIIHPYFLFKIQYG